MTIAGCYVSPEGVVFGSDSATTYNTNKIMLHYNHSQKLFEIGVDSKLAAVTWGLGGLEFDSYRRLFAIFADQLREKKFGEFREIAQAWTDFFWEEYSKSRFYTDPNTGIVGFCIGGVVDSNRMPSAWVTIFEPTKGKPNPQEARKGFNFWGAPNMIDRLLGGYDWDLRTRLLSSGKWGGSEGELDSILQAGILGHVSIMPIRDAIDFMHSCIYSTIKAYKFSHFPLICGGPIEIGVITTDRPFRWVMHKEWTSAIREGD